MRIKSLKLKAENENIEVIFSNFFTNGNYIYGIYTNLNLVEDEFYWFILIIYEPKKNFEFDINMSDDKILPEGYINAVNVYCNNHINLKSRVRNTIESYKQELFEVKYLDDFLKFRGIGIKTLKDEIEFFKGLLDIIKKYQ